MENFSYKLSALRNEYSAKELSKEGINNDPLLQFEKWFNEALETKVLEPNAFILSTATREGKPSARVLLLKGVSRGGFTFFTNYQSKKARHIEDNPFGAMVFFWPELERQVRIEGEIHKVTPEESDEYFVKRPLGSRLGAWASKQSEVIPDREYLRDKMKQLEEKTKGSEIERPDYWGGYRMMPGVIEFWQGRPNRLHDRLQYTLKDGNWKIERLSP